MTQKIAILRTITQICQAVSSQLSSGLTEFCPVQNSLYVQVLRSPILAALLYGTPAAGISQTLRRGTRNGITELSQTAIRLGGYHSR